MKLSVAYKPRNLYRRGQAPGWASSLLIKWLMLVSLMDMTLGCGPGRGAGRRRGAHKLTPLVFKQHVPNVSENSLGASGLAEGRITRDDHRFRDLIPNYNSDIIFKDEEGTGADRFMTQRCKDKLNTLAISVMNQWPGVRLRVTEGWDEENHHAIDSLHYEGRAVDVTTSDRDRSKYGMLAKLAVEAGFDWVYYESRAHIHCSVKSESSQAVKSGGCFPGTATVRTRDGQKVPLSSLRPGDEVQTINPNTNELQYSPVLMFLDRDPNEVRDFLEIGTRSGQVLVLTPSHLVMLRKAAEPVPLHLTNSYRTFSDTAILFAANIEVNDWLVVVDEKGKSTFEQVVSVNNTRLRGVFAPLTAEGNLIVNDVLVSCYAVVNSHSLAHLVYGPLRFYQNVRASLDRLWQIAFKPLQFVHLTQNKTSISVPSGIHWYAKSLYEVAEFILPKDWRYHI